MKTLTYTQARAAHPLAAAVLWQLGGGLEAVQSALDAARHGADWGFHGFIYTADCASFALRNRRAILASLKEDADGIGEGGVISLVKSFRRGGDFTEEEIATALYGQPKRGDGIHDAASAVLELLARYALEEVGAAIERECEQ
jgi:hypothetical protein